MEDIYRAAQIANAHDFIQEFPKGYDTLVGEKGVLLSGRKKPPVKLMFVMGQICLFVINNNNIH